MGGAQRSETAGAVGADPARRPGKPSGEGAQAAVGERYISPPLSLQKASTTPVEMQPLLADITLGQAYTLRQTIERRDALMATRLLLPNQNLLLYAGLRAVLRVKWYRISASNWYSVTPLQAACMALLWASALNWPAVRNKAIS